MAALAVDGINGLRCNFRILKRVLINKKQAPFHPGVVLLPSEHELFANCCKEKMWRILSTGINCTIAEMEPIIPRNATMKKCDERNDAKIVYWRFIYLLENIYLQPWKYGCHIPCKQTSYTFKVNYFHKNNVFMPDNTANNSKDHLYMYVHFQTSSVEEKVENLEYDLANLLVSAGGNLGLFMGLSCLSVLFYAIDSLQAILLPKYHP